MSNELFLFSLAVTFTAIFAWAFRALPRERWQILAALPRHKIETGKWQGMNLTFYGFFQAASNTLGVVVLFLLLGSIGVGANAVFALITAVFALCWPAARLIARLVEKKAHTFTIGGALFVGVLATPWLIELVNSIFSAIPGNEPGNRIPVVPALATLAIGYAYGEGLGRLACISFGCCYGKSVAELSPRLRRMFTSLSFTFAGATKKAAYEGQLEGVRLVPVQAITSVIFIIIALIGTYLFLQSHFKTAMLLTMLATQIWRFLSETLRADVRGKAEIISAYQVMALLMVVYCAIIAFAFSDAPPQTIAIANGLSVLWNPAVILFCQA
ncbi:MAG: prolipoprotein diacylglyceryl transferase family protein, partial [Blastocatellia bacterium]